MIRRKYWLKRLQDAWSRRSIVWLAGVRRVGKTTLAKMLPEATYLNCDLPSTQRTLLDPELFLRSNPTDKLLVLDEVHRLADPSHGLCSWWRTGLAVRKKTPVAVCVIKGVRTFFEDMLAQIPTAVDR